MINKTVNPALAILFVMTIISAQTDYALEPVRQIGFGLGGVHYQVRDDIVAPLRWDGAGGSVTASYLIHSQRRQLGIEMRFPIAVVTNRYDHTGFGDELSIRYDYLTRLAGNETKGQVHLGGMLEWSLNHQLYLNWDDSHLYWLNSYAAGPVAKWSRAAGHGRNWGVRFTFPLLAFVSRPPEYRYQDQEPMHKPGYWFTRPHEDMRLTSVHEFIMLDLRCDYTWQLGRKIALNAALHSSYKADARPKKIRLFTNTLLLEFLFGTGSSQGGR